MDEAKVAVSGFVIAAGTSRSVFEPVEPESDNVAQGRDGGTDRLLDQPVPLGRDDSDAATLLHIFAHEVSVITFAGEQHLGRLPVDIHDRQIAFVIGDFAAGQAQAVGRPIASMRRWIFVENRPFEPPRP